MEKSKVIRGFLVLCEKASLDQLITMRKHIGVKILERKKSEVSS